MIIEGAFDTWQAYQEINEFNRLRKDISHSHRMVKSEMDYLEYVRKNYDRIAKTRQKLFQGEGLSLPEIRRNIEKWNKMPLKARKMYEDFGEGSLSTEEVLDVIKKEQSYARAVRRARMAKHMKGFTKGRIASEALEQGALALYNASEENQGMNQRQLKQLMDMVSLEYRRIIIDSIEIRYNEESHRNLMRELADVSKRSIHEIVNTRLRNIVFRASQMLEGTSEWIGSQEDARRAVKEYLRSPSRINPKMSIAEYLVMREASKKKNKPHYLAQSFPYNPNTPVNVQAERYIEWTANRQVKHRSGWYKYAFTSAGNKLWGRPQATSKKIGSHPVLGNPPGEGILAREDSWNPKATAIIKPRKADSSVMMAVEKSIQIDMADMAIYVERKITGDLNKIR